MIKLYIKGKLTAEAQKIFFALCQKNKNSLKQLINGIEIKNPDKNVNTNLLILPGVFSNYEEFLKIYTSPILTKKTNIHVMELRNHGSSPSTYNANHLIMGQDIINYINAKSLQNVVLLGHSLGGKNAIKACQRNQLCNNEIKGLINIDQPPVDYCIDKNKYKNVHLLLPFMFQLNGLNPIKLGYTRTVETIMNIFKSRPKIGESIIEKVLKLENDQAKWRHNLAALACSQKYLMSWQQDDAYDKQFHGITKFICSKTSTYTYEDDLQYYLPKYFPKINLKEDVQFVESGHFIHMHHKDTIIKLASDMLDEVKQYQKLM